MVIAWATAGSGYAGLFACLPLFYFLSNVTFSQVIGAWQGKVQVSGLPWLV